jgi:hypothetical protein
VCVREERERGREREIIYSDPLLSDMQATTTIFVFVCISKVDHFLRMNLDPRQGLSWSDFLSRYHATKTRLHLASWNCSMERLPWGSVRPMDSSVSLVSGI